MLKNVLYGITHTEEGLPIIREPKLVKVSIGLPKGKAIYAFKGKVKGESQWIVRIGYEKEKIVTKAFSTRPEAEKFYYESLPKAPDAKSPRDNRFFLFTRKVNQADGSDHYEPAWDVIEAHGDTPTSIPVLFLDDDPFSGNYAMWSATELKCSGDGIDGERVLSMAKTPEEKKLAEQAKAEGKRTFPIVNGCWCRDCSFSKPVLKGEKEYPSPCHPSLDLKFQLAKSLRVGGTCYFHSGSIKSVSQTFSAIERIRSITRGRIAGIPLVMTVSSFKANHNGFASTKYCVSFEFRSEDTGNIQKALLEQAFSFKGLAPAPPKLIEAAEENISPLTASDMAAEFYPEPDDEGDNEGGAATDSPAAAATKAKTEDVVARMAAAKAAKDAQAAETSNVTTSEPVTGEAKAAETEAPTSAKVEQPTSAAIASPEAKPEESGRKRRPVF